MKMLRRENLQNLCRIKGARGQKKGRPPRAGLEALIPDGSEVGSGGQRRVVALALLLYREELVELTARTRKV